jgi:putative oxidoreductase
MAVHAKFPQSGYVLSLLRIVVGFAFCCHGAQKLFGVFGGMGGHGAKATALSLLWFAAIIEFFGGLLVILGLFTRPVALLLCGEMAVAYFRVHAPRGFWPITNMGELAVLYCFIFLYFFAAGPGPLSLDRMIRKRAV